MNRQETITPSMPDLVTNKTSTCPLTTVVSSDDDNAWIKSCSNNRSNSQYGVDNIARWLVRLSLHHRSEP